MALKDSPAVCAKCRSSPSESSVSGKYDTTACLFKEHVTDLPDTTDKSLLEARKSRLLTMTSVLHVESSLQKAGEYSLNNMEKLALHDNTIDLSYNRPSYQISPSMSVQWYTAANVTIISSVRYGGE